MNSKRSHLDEKLLQSKESDDDEINNDDLEEYYQVALTQLLEKLKESNKIDVNHIAALDEFMQNAFNLFAQFNNHKFLQSLERKIQVFIEKEEQIEHIDELYRILGDSHYKTCDYIAAINYYKKAIECSHETNLLAIEAYENLMNNIVKRWHFAILNDLNRNMAYSKAIEKRLLSIIEEKKKSNKQQLKITILDIGTGSGLLTAQCVTHAMHMMNRADILQVYSFEKNPFLYEIAKRFLGEFNLKDSVKIINKHTNDIVLSEDLENSEIDLVITEIFDDGLLGEGSLSTFFNLLHVKSLFKNESLPTRQLKEKLIPQYGRLFICAIESSQLRKASVFNKKIQSKRNKDIYNININSLDDSTMFSANYQNQKDMKSIDFDPYTSENMRQIDYRQLSERVELKEFEIRFYDENQLKELVEKNKFLTISKEIEFMCDGRLDAFMLWFELHLDDDLIISNSPFIDSVQKNNIYISSSWNQAIYASHTERFYEKGQIKSIHLKLQKDCLLIIDDSYCNESASIFSCTNSIKFHLDRSVILSLNNQPYQQFYLNFEQILNSFIARRNQLNEKFETQKIKVGFMFDTLNLAMLNLAYEYYPYYFYNGKKITIDISLLISNREDFDSNLKHIVKEHFKKRLNVKFLDCIFDSKTKSNSLYNLFDFDFLIYEPFEHERFVLKKNLLSNLIFLKSINKNKGK
jgi:predicted RNA methylase